MKTVISKFIEPIAIGYSNDTERKVLTAKRCEDYLPWASGIFLLIGVPVLFCVAIALLLIALTLET